MNWPEEIRSCFESDKVLYTSHARMEMRNEEFGQITDQEVCEARYSCEVIEEYPDDTPYPSSPVLEKTQAGRPIHAVCAYRGEDQKIVLVTVYQPNPDRWEDNRRRKPGSV